MTGALRSFSEADQLAFARLSGDENPIHVDPVEARRLLFGEPVVHGMHLVLWLLDTLAGGPARQQRITRLRASFRRPVLVGERVDLAVELLADSAKATVVGPRGPCASLAVEWTAAGRDLGRLGLPRPIPIACADLDFAHAASAHGELPLVLDLADLAAIAPAVSRQWPAHQIAAVLGLTRLVGMICPGRHSVFNSFKLEFDAGSDAGDHLSYRVVAALERYARLSIGISAPGISGEIQASFRPAPTRQASISDLSGKVAADEFAACRALVIGGSRGLGELVAKLVVAGGGEVCLTFARGRADAERVVAEIGPRARAVPFDVTGPVDALRAEFVGGGLPTDLYYFASPRILLDPAPPFDEQRFASFAEVYVSRFVRLVRHLSTNRTAPLRVFYPSSVFVDLPVAGSLEYAAAKAAGEAACMALAKELGVSIVVRRLPALATDQTQSLLGMTAADPCVAMLEAVRAVAATSKTHELRS